MLRKVNNYIIDWNLFGETINSWSFLYTHCIRSGDMEGKVNLLIDCPVWSNYLPHYYILYWNLPKVTCLKCRTWHKYLIPKCSGSQHTDNLLPLKYTNQLIDYIYDWGCRGCNRMVIRFTTTYAISAYHHQSCEFGSRP